MKIVIVGAGEVGTHLGAVLSGRGDDVTIVEHNPERAARVDEELDVRVITGPGGSAATLHQAEVDASDYFIAMTSNDESNLVACSLARAIGARTVICRIHDLIYTETGLLNYPLHFGIDMMLNPEALSAAEFAKSIRNPGRLAVEHIARGMIEAQRIRVDAAAPWQGKALRELRLPAEVRVGYTERGGVEDVPTADTVIEAGDVVTVFGPPDQLDQIRPKLDPQARTGEVRVVIFGGSETAVALIRLLNHPRFRVSVIERNLDKCRRLAERFAQVTFINGDGTSLRLLEEEQVGMADYFVASTSDDERNVMTSVQAAKLGARHVQTVVNKTDYEDILDNLRGTLRIETLVSPRRVTANEVVRYISPEPWIELFRFPRQAARIVEIRVAADSPAAGKTLRELGWPRHAVAVALLHKFQAKVPGADDRILGGDRVVVVTREDNLRALVRQLT
jgi:trk system potassium uptake protein TrkA